jgi:flagellar hook protein FlgE
MFGAIYIGLSGLNAYSRGLQEVSNNVTNLNTSGFKSTTVSFQNFYGNKDSGGLSYTPDNNGSGNGVGLGESRLSFQQGELRQSSRDLDLAVDGTGFLVLLDGTETLYARTGSFEVDKDGYIVMSGTEYRLAALDASNHPVALSVDAVRTNPPKATTTIKFADNLSSTATSFAVSDLRVYDASGGAHVWKAAFARDTSAGTGAWKVTVTDDKGATVGTQSLKFTGSTVDPTTSKLDFTDSAAALTVSLDFSGAVTSFSSGEVSTLRSASIDGQAVGTITTVTVNSKGKLEVGYSNAQKQELGSIAIADFRDPQSLEQRSGGIFAQTGSGSREFLSSEDPRVGQVTGKRLEASNVDLSQQFGDLILIQRGFQAASQIVSVSNDMIQQLFGIRGQG